MFTGIVESQGAIAHLGPGRETRRLLVTTGMPVEGMALGASIAVDGVCLTIIERGAGRFAADLGPETLARTTLGRRAAGDTVHLERPLAAGDPLGGHLVSGHVDGLGVLVATRPRGDARELEIAAPPELGRFIVEKGSIAVDGVSLTVNFVDGARFGVTLIPHTLAQTHLGALAAGAAVNLEVDMIARQVASYVDRYVDMHLGAIIDRKLGSAR